jgi:hypothetical protein
MQTMNKQITDPAWKFTAEDVTALMGSHGMMDMQNCMTTGVQPATAPAIDDRTCAGSGGRQRMFTWDTHYFKVRSPHLQLSFQFISNVPASSTCNSEAAQNRPAETNQALLICLSTNYVIKKTVIPKAGEGKLRLECVGVASTNTKCVFVCRM